MPPTETGEVQKNTEGAPLDAKLQASLDAFAQDPTDQRAFAMLEERLFLAGAWQPLSVLYGRRLTVLDEGTAERSNVLLRLGGLLEERLQLPREAMRRYQQLLASVPQHPVGLASLRRVYVAMGDIASALQIAEFEEKLDGPPRERARTLTEIGDMWRGLGETSEAMSRYQKALESDPESDAALTGLADLALDAGDRERAIELYERRLQHLKGSSRSDALEALARVTEDEDRVREILREVVRSRANRPYSLRRLVTLEHSAGDTEAAQRLLQRLWMKIEEPQARLALALEAATEALGASAPVETVLLWLDEAGEVGGDDPRVHELRARMFRRAGNRAGLIHALEALQRIEGQGAMRQLEIAVLYERENQPERAARAAISLLEQEPNDRDALALVDRCLARTGRDLDRPDLLERRIQLAESDEEYAQLSVELGDLSRDLLDDPGAAEEWYRRALARCADHLEAAARLKQLYQKLERYNELDAFLEGTARSARAPADRARELCELGRVRLELRHDQEGARAALISALEAEPGCEPALAALRILGAGTSDTRAPGEPAALELEEPQPPVLDPLESELAAELELVAEAEPEALPLDEEPEIEIEVLPVEQPVPSPEPPVKAQRFGAAPIDSSVAEPGRDDPNADHLRSLIAAARGSGDLGRALQVAERWVELSAEVEPLLVLASLAREHGDAPRECAALEGLCSLLETEPAQRATGLERLAELTLAQQTPDSLDRALDLYRDALALAPGARLRGVLLELCQQAGHAREVADLLAQQLADPQGTDPSGPLRVRMARVLCEIGARDEAIKALQPAFEQDPADLESADLLEGLLASEGRVDELAALIDRRLERERDPVRRRELAHRLGGVLLDELERPDEAVARLRELADPSRDAPLEELFERALESGAAPDEHETWLLQRESHLQGQAGVDVLLRLASLQQASGRMNEAIATLKRGAHSVPRDQLDAVGRPLLHLLRQLGDPEAQLEVLAHLREESRAPEARVGFALESARILIDQVGRLDEGRSILALLGEPADIPSAELRQLAGLHARAGSALLQIAALETLGSRVNQTQSSVAARRELAQLLASGPAEVRDPERAGELIAALLEQLEGDSAQSDELLVLLEQTGDGERLIAVLQTRLDRPDLSALERCGLALRLAELHQKRGDPDGAIATLRAARAQGPTGEAVDETLFRALEASGQLEARVELCADKATKTRGAGRECWLRRWLAALAQTRAPAETRLAVTEELLSEVRDDPELNALRIRLLRALDRRETLARALEALLRDTPPPRARRRLIVRELLRLYEGPLRTPERALALLERELLHDPTLRTRSLRLARTLGDAAHEARLLAPLHEDGTATREQARRLALALSRAGRMPQAEPLLWKALEANPSDAEVLGVLEGVVRERDDPARLLRLLESHFALENAERRAEIAEEGLRLADRLRDPEAGLRWVRRWHAVDTLPRPIVERWVEMERGLGDRHGLFTALRLLRQLADGDHESAAVLAQEAALHAASGQIELAREAYEQALRLTPRPPCEWLASLDRILAIQGRVLRRSGLLRDLTRHSDLSPAERERYREVRADLLASHPDLRDEAAAELEQLIAEDRRGSDDVRVARMRTLLDLYEELERISDWCDLASRLRPHLAAEDQPALERSLARRRTRHGFARDEAIAGWERILEAAPEDHEALEALVGLLQYPGVESRRLAYLEQLARSGTPENPNRWLEAAELRWRLLRDAREALADLDAALALEPRFAAAHELRAEICAHLGRADEEAKSLRALVEHEADGPAAARRWLRLAELALRSLERHEEARLAAERALATGQELDGLRLQACAVFQQIGEWERACELLHAELESPLGDRRAELLGELSRIEWDERRRAEPACAAFAMLEAERELEAEECDRWADALGALEQWPEALRRRREALAKLADAVGGQDWLELARLALEKCDDVALAREACDRALERDAALLPALELRAELWSRDGDVQAQIDDLVALGERQPDGLAGAEAYSRAAQLAGSLLGDEAHAWALFRNALRREPGHRAALLGAGRIALARQEWAEAERMFAMALALLGEHSDEDEPLAEVARLAAEAALAQQRSSEALHYLERSLAADPRSPAALDAMAELSLRLGVHPRARQCLELRLEDEALSAGERADRLLLLARACEGVDAPDRAVEALESAIQLRNTDTLARERLADLLVKLARPAQAVSAIDAWLELAPADQRPSLVLRAARLEVEAGRPQAASERLERLSQSEQATNEVWVERARLALLQNDATAASAIVGEALVQTRLPAERALLLWLRTRAQLELGQSADAARGALETLELDLLHVEAAELLARNLGRVGEWRPAVTLLERFLDANQPAADIESELWEAVGRAYAGPLESMERAERCYRRSLDANPKRASAREALADITAFDPAAHRESVHLHRDLLYAFPARPGSWRAIAQIAEHWGRERAQATCLLVLDGLRVSGPAGQARSDAQALIHTGASENPGVLAATELLAALNEANRLPDVAAGGPDKSTVPIQLRVQLVELAGPGWDLGDAQLEELWRRPLEESLLAGDGLSRRRRRDLQKALKDPQADQLRSLTSGQWREELLAQAAARTVDQGTLSLGEALRALLAMWPSTADFDLDAAGNLAETIQLCPPAQGLLMRVADTTLGSLGLS